MSFGPSLASIKTAPVRVLVVDDSAVIRGLITRALEGDSDIKVVGSAGNGELAIDVLKRVPADVVVLDIEMPVMDGLAAIPRLKAIDPAVQIVMASTLTQKNAEISLKAMALGATDYVAKPSSRELATPGDFQRELVEKAKTLAALARKNGVRETLSDAAGRAARFVPPPAEKKKVVLRAGAVPRPDIIAIGSSTGGPQALFQVIKAMGAGLAQPVVITQHMPPAFTTILADHISRQCGVTCVESADGDILQPGRYYLAPGDYHLLLVKKTEGVAVRLTKDAQENFCRPAVDPMLRSLVAVYGNRVLAVILTGMGQDGWKGCEAVVQAGGGVIAQDEASSVVWGMPGAVAMAGICSAVLPLTEIGPMAKQVAARGKP